MERRLALVSVLVRSYDEALAFYTDILGFELVEDVYQAEQNKRWVVVRPGAGGSDVLLAQASSPDQRARIGDQTGGRVFLFLETDDFWRDYRDYCARGVRFVRDPANQPYGTVAVFEDLYGNRWDLIQRGLTDWPEDAHGAA